GLGDPADEDTDVGPVIDDGARERILEWIEESRGEVLTGGDLEGELIRPTVIANPARDDKVSCEEVFGPVCTVTTVESLDEAIELANATRYGLQAGVFTTRIEAALRAAQALDFGGGTFGIPIAFVAIVLFVLFLLGLGRRAAEGKP